jgi:hypothetical protein
MKTNNSKVSQRLMMLTMAVVVAVGISIPRPSHALMALVGESDILNGSGDVILCLVLLPLCLLDKEVEGLQVSEQTLRDNGYGDAEIEDIFQGQQMMFKAIKAKKINVEKRIMNKPKILSTELEKQIPGIPQSYIEFVRNN